MLLLRARSKVFGSLTRGTHIGGDVVNFWGSSVTILGATFFNIRISIHYSLLQWTKVQTDCFFKANG